MRINCNLAKNIIPTKDVFNIDKEIDRSNYSNLIDSYTGGSSLKKLNNAETLAIEEEEGRVKIIDLNQYPCEKAVKKFVQKRNKRSASCSQSGPADP